MERGVDFALEFEVKTTYSGIIKTNLIAVCNNLLFRIR